MNNLTDTKQNSLILNEVKITNQPKIKSNNNKKASDYDQEIPQSHTKVSKGAGIDKIQIHIFSDNLIHFNLYFLPYPHLTTTLLVFLGISNSLQDN